jgi:hypothetical protein
MTIEKMREYLKQNGWYQLWSDDNWLQEGVNYTNPDWAGMSTEMAYKYVKAHEDMELVEVRSIPPDFRYKNWTTVRKEVADKLGSSVEKRFCD